MHAARPLAGVCQVSKRRLQLLLGLVHAAARDMNTRATSSAERKKRLMVVGSGKRLEHIRPLRRPVGIAGELARGQEAAADIGECLDRRLLATRDGRHRLVEPKQPLVHVAARDLREP